MGFLSRLPEFGRPLIEPLRHVALSCSVLLLLLAGDAEAVPFVEDFESGKLGAGEDPPGAWEDEQFLQAGNTLQTATEAAHRGTLGLRFVDGNAASGSREEGRLRRQIAGTPPNFYLRVWFRLTQSNFEGNGFLIEFAERSLGRSLAEVSVNFETRRLTLAGFNAAGEYRRDETDFQVVLGQWHLLELSIAGAGGSNGARTLRVDGQRRAQRTGINFNGTTPSHYAVGETWTDNGIFTGTLDFDDLVADTAAVGSTLMLTTPVTQSNIRAGDCLPLLLELKSGFDGTFVAAPYRIESVLESSGANEGLGFYTDSGCAAPTETGLLVGGSSSSVFYVRPVEVGSVTLKAAHPDFLSQALTLPVAMGDLANGQPCGLGIQCASDFCVDGVCCDSACDVGACDVCAAALGAPDDGVCSVAPAGVACREAASVCDVREVCDGQSAQCPADSVTNAGVACREVAGVCDVAESCDGTSPLCPEDGFLPGNTPCISTGASGQSYCSGASPECGAEVEGLPSDGGDGGKDRVCEETGLCIDEGGCVTGAGMGPGSLCLLAMTLASLFRRRPRSSGRG